MTSLRNILHKFRLRPGRLRGDPNYRGVTCFPPGHFHSPLIDVRSLDGDNQLSEVDGGQYWECVDLREADQEAYYRDLLDIFQGLTFPTRQQERSRYYCENTWFPFADAFALAAIIQMQRPRRIVEVGSGFSSAVMLDTCEHAGLDINLTCIEPHPDRLRALLKPRDLRAVNVVERCVQEIPGTSFSQLTAGDILFIDSSHVAKVGSDVTHLLLRVLPHLNPGVLVHFHDIFYPFSYPVAWLREGRAWNESLFLRAFLTGNAHIEVLAFNSFAGSAFPTLFRDRLPQLLSNTGGSLRLRRVGQTL